MNSEEFMRNIIRRRQTYTTVLLPKSQLCDGTGLLDEDTFRPAGLLAFLLVGSEKSGQLLLRI